MRYTRALWYLFPLFRGEDVLALQLRLRHLGIGRMSQPDGKFSYQSDDAIRTFQRASGLKVDGVVGPRTWSVLFADAAPVPITPAPSAPAPSTPAPSMPAAARPPATARTAVQARVLSLLTDLGVPHRFRDSVSWRLGPTGITIDGGAPEITGGEPDTVRRVWQQFGEPIQEWAAGFGIPAELIIATICTETRGEPGAVREEPGYFSDQATPAKVSPGIMQTLISTARAVLGDDTINRHWLLEPGNSIRAGTAYIASQWKATSLDPPKVACAYNAGAIYYNDSPRNRWKMKQYPIGGSEHADRFVRWFNDCFMMFDRDRVRPNLSFYGLLNG